MSQNDLAFEVRIRHGRRLTGQAIGQFERGENGPSFAALEAMLDVLDADERDWPELVLGRARRMLDERAVGLEQALANLERVRAALGLSGPDGAADDEQREASPTAGAVEAARALRQRAEARRRSA